METITVPTEKLKALFSDVERLVSHFEDLMEDQDKIVKQRLDALKSRKIKGKSEEELDKYLKARGVNIA